MKKLCYGLFILFSLAFTADHSFRDGVYSGVSRSVYVYEPFYGCTQLTIENGRITDVNFIIRDSAKHENFDSNYSRYFEGNELYMEQCRKDWKGVQSYPDTLIKYQDLGKVDAISGATWAYNMFKASAEIALEKAK